MKYPKEYYSPDFSALDIASSKYGEELFTSLEQRIGNLPLSINQSEILKEFDELSNKEIHTRQVLIYLKMLHAGVKPEGIIESEGDVIDTEYGRNFIDEALFDAIHIINTDKDTFPFQDFVFIPYSNNFTTVNIN